MEKNEIYYKMVERGKLHMNKLMGNNDEIQVISTREIASMMETGHDSILRKLNGRKDSKSKGIVEVLGLHHLDVSDYFIESTYINEQNKVQPEYLCTKIGCDFLANKFTGEKGILFTAKYVKRFEEMKKELNKPSVPQSYAHALLEAGRLALENEQLQLDNQRKQEVIEVITKDNITFDEFNKRVRSLVGIISRNKSISYGEVWRILYSYIDLKIGVNLKLRQTYKMRKLQENRIEDGKKSYTQSTLKQKVSVLSCVKEDEYDQFLRIISCYANEQGIDITDYNKLTIESEVA